MDLSQKSPFSITNWAQKSARQNSNPCTGSLILGSLVLGFSVLGLRILSPRSPLLCEDANSKLADVVTVFNIDDEDHVSNSLLQI